MLLAKNFKGYWNPESNLPTSPSVLVQPGDYLIVSVEGISNITGLSESYQLSDFLVKTSNGYYHYYTELSKTRITVTVENYAAALNEAVGSQWKSIKVVSDENNEGKTTFYNYDGDEGIINLVTGGGGGVSGVSSVNNKTGDVKLTKLDVQLDKVPNIDTSLTQNINESPNKLFITDEEKNKIANSLTNTSISTSTDLGSNDSQIPSQKAVKIYVDNKVIMLRGEFTDSIIELVQLIGERERYENKSNDTALGTSSTLYPTQNAVKTYIDTQLSPILDILNDVESVSNKSNDSNLGTSTSLYPTQGAVKIYIDNAIAAVEAGEAQIPVPTFSNQVFVI